MSWTRRVGSDEQVAAAAVADLDSLLQAASGDLDESFDAKAEAGEEDVDKVINPEVEEASDVTQADTQRRLEPDPRKLPTTMQFGGDVIFGAALAEQSAVTTDDVEYEAFLALGGSLTETV